MVPNDQQLHRAAARLASALLEGRLLNTPAPPADVEKRIFEALRKDFQEELAIERDAERIFEENKRQTVGMDQRTLIQKIKEKLAGERGFVL